MEYIPASVAGSVWWSRTWTFSGRVLSARKVPIHCGWSPCTHRGVPFCFHDHNSTCFNWYHKKNQPLERQFTLRRTYHIDGFKPIWCRPYRFVWVGLELIKSLGCWVEPLGLMVTWSVRDFNSSQWLNHSWLLVNIRICGEFAVNLLLVGNNRQLTYNQPWIKTTLRL